MAICTDCGSYFSKRHDWEVRCFPCWRARKDANLVSLPSSELLALRESAKRGESLRAALGEHLPRMIRLCHPDRHGNSEASNIVTRWLLALREEV